MRGTASDVLGMESETWLRKTVSDSRTVTSEMLSSINSLWSLYCIVLSFIFSLLQTSKTNILIMLFFSAILESCIWRDNILNLLELLSKLIIIETKNNIWTAKYIDWGILIIQVDYIDSRWSLVSLTHSPLDHNTSSYNTVCSHINIILRMKYWIYWTEHDLNFQTNFISIQFN